MYRLMTANKSDGRDSRTLSFIFILTTNPENIRSDKPFDMNIMDGDSSFRKIPVDIQLNDLHNRELSYSQ